MPRYILVSLLFLISAVCPAQILNVRVVCRLPDSIGESSGIECRSSASLYTHNDSGDEARFFVVDTFGNLLNTIYLDQVTASDWEDMTQDPYGNVYIGDFGNNLNNRKDLKIYKIGVEALEKGDTVQPGIIHFTYPDQHAFPPDSSAMNFDCESMFYYGDSLYLFSKNRGSSTWCKMYVLPCLPGEYTAHLADSFNTTHWITSADINPDGSAVVLLSENRIWLFTAFKNRQFFKGEARHFEIPLSQKEAIVFYTHDEVFLTDERWADQYGMVYAVDLDDYIPDFPSSASLFSIFPNPAQNCILLTSNLNLEMPAELKLYTASGQLVKSCYIKLIPGTVELPIYLTDLTKGLYLLKISPEGMEPTTKKFEIQ